MQPEELTTTSIDRFAVQSIAGIVGGLLRVLISWLRALTMCQLVDDCLMGRLVDLVPASLLDALADGLSDRQCIVVNCTIYIRKLEL